MRALKGRREEVGVKGSWGSYLGLPTGLKTIQGSFIEKGASI